MKKCNNKQYLKFIIDFESYGKSRLKTAMAAPFQFQPVGESWLELLHLEEEDWLREPSGNFKLNYFFRHKYLIFWSHGRSISLQNSFLSRADWRLPSFCRNGLARGHVILFTLHSLCGA